MLFYIVSGFLESSCGCCSSTEIGCGCSKTHFFAFHTPSASASAPAFSHQPSPPPFSNPKIGCGCSKTHFLRFGPASSPLPSAPALSLAFSPPRAAPAFRPAQCLLSSWCAMISCRAKQPNVQQPNIQASQTIKPLSVGRCHHGVC